ncbi:MAG: hypothetical protein ABJF05_12360, partial [Paracoccaceae bacterium]
GKYRHWCQRRAIVDNPRSARIAGDLTAKYPQPTWDTSDECGLFGFWPLSPARNRVWSIPGCPSVPPIHQHDWASRFSMTKCAL